MKSVFVVLLPLGLVSCYGELSDRELLWAYAEAERDAWEVCNDWREWHPVWREAVLEAAPSEFVWREMEDCEPPTRACLRTLLRPVPTCARWRWKGCRHDRGFVDSSVLD